MGKIQKSSFYSENLHFSMHFSVVLHLFELNKRAVLVSSPNPTHKIEPLLR
jgi:hypothetical protein